MKKIILIQSKVGSWEFIQDAPMVPLALLLVSSYLAGKYNIKIIDQRTDKNWESALKNELTDDLLCVGITTMTGPQILYALEASKIVKESSSSPVIWGGIHPSILPDQTVKHPYVDIVVSGEGDKVFADLVRCIDEGKPYGHIPGIWTKDGNKAVGSVPDIIADINILPSIPYELINISDYISYDREGRRKFPIKTSRGCPYRCTFCHQTGKYRRKWRSFAAGRVLEEIKMLKNRYNIGHFQILDDNFFVDTERAHQILIGIRDAKLNIKFTINGSRVNDILRMKEDTIKLLADIGCYELQVGLESGSQRILDHMKKDIKLSEIFDANKRLKKYNIPRYYELVSGFKEEGRQDLMETAKVILELSKDDQNVFFAPLECLTPYPGTEVYSQAEDEGMKFPEDLEGWGRYQWNKAQLPWLNSQQRKLLESFHIFPTLISYEIKTLRSAVARFLFRLYRPWARFRVRRLFFRFSFETYMFNLLARPKS